MIGDKLVITVYHRNGAAKALQGVTQKLEKDGRGFAVSIAGESGSGKSEIAHVLAELLEAKGYDSLVLCQDDYFRLPPKSNHQRRKEDIDWVGPGEVRLDLMAAHVSHLLEHPDRPLSKPLVMFDEDAITCETLEPAERDVVIIEGTYTSLVDGVDIRVFIDRDYINTKKSRKLRSRDPSSAFIEQVLAIEHEIISRHRGRASIIIDPPGDDELEPSP